MPQPLVFLIDRITMMDPCVIDAYALDARIVGNCANKGSVMLNAG